MRWQLRCIRDSLKALVPFQNQLRRFKYTVLPFQRDVDRDLDAIRDGLRQLSLVRSALPGQTLANTTVMEIGSGWQPVIPILFSLAGAQCILQDVSRLLVASSLYAALLSIRDAKAELLPHIHQTSDDFDELIARALLQTKGRFADCSGALQLLRLKYHAPSDSCSTGLPSASVDAVISRAVLEHIPGEIIPRIFRECRRVLKPNGVMCHIIDNSDHWEHQDHRISKVNFLQFSRAVFSLTCFHPLNYQNRLRHTEYLAMVSDAGFDILFEEPRVDRDSLEALEKMKVAEPFERFSRSDLAAVTSYIVARVKM